MQSIIDLLLCLLLGWISLTTKKKKISLYGSWHVSPRFFLAFFGILYIMISLNNSLVKENKNHLRFWPGPKWICLNKLTISASWELPILLKLGLLIGKQVLQISGDKRMYMKDKHFMKCAIILILSLFSSAGWDRDFGYDSKIITKENMSVVMPHEHN